MAEKDPKDMTASELLRHIARTVEDEECASDAITWLRMKAGTEEAPNYGAEMANALEAVANKIDAEIEAARRGDSNDTFLMILDRLITLNSYPSRCEGEPFDQWLERCFIPRPRDKAGEPVQFGDYDIDWDETDECRNPGALWEATAVDCSGNLLATAGSKIIAVAKTDESGRVKRRAAEAFSRQSESERRRYESEAKRLSDANARLKEELHQERAKVSARDLKIMQLEKDSAALADERLAEFLRGMADEAENLGGGWSKARVVEFIMTYVRKIEGGEWPCASTARECWAM